IIAKFRFRNFTASLRLSAFGLGKLDAILAVVKLRERLDWLHSFAFVHENMPNPSPFHRADDAALSGDDGSIRAHAHRPGDQNENGGDNCGGFSIKGPRFFGTARARAFFFLAT